MVVLLETLDEGIGVVGRVIVDDIGWVVAVDLVDVFSELAAGLGLDLLDLLETAGLNEGTLGLEVGGEDLGELGAHVGEDVVGGELEEGLKGGKVGAHLDDVLKGFLCLILKVLGAFGKHVDGKEAGRNVSLSEELSVIGGVATDLAKGPGSSGLEVIFRLVDQGILKRSNTLGDDDSHSEGVVEGRDVTEGHDTWESGVTLGFTDVIDDSGSTTRVHDELSELSGLLGDFSDAGGGILADLDIKILQAVKDAGEDLSLNDNLSKIDGVLSNLSKAGANLTLELGIGVADEGSEVGNGTLVNDGLGQFLGVLSDLRKSGGRDSLESELGLLDAKDQETNGTGVNDGLSELVGVLGNASEGPGGSLLDGGVELLKAVNEGIKGTRVDNSLSKVRRVLGNRAEHVSGSLLVESLYK